MRIDGIASCVGELYCKYFLNALPVWVDTLDSLSVVTAPEDPIIPHLEQYGNVRVVTTTVFTEYNAHFNKGAALNLAYMCADPYDWVLHLDADVIPPPNWRKVLEQRRLCHHSIYGASRVSTNGLPCRPITSFFRPFGYFQLWHSQTQSSLRWPMFQTWHAHAGAYDMEFLEQWPREQWRKLPFVLVHQGKQRANWFGVGKEKMMRLVYNPRKYRLEANRGVGILKLPQPLLRLRLVPGNQNWINTVLRWAREQGLYDVQVITYSNPIEGFETIDDKTSIGELDIRLQELL